MKANDKIIVPLAIIIFASIVLSLAICREGWMDEFITLKFTDPLQPASTLYKTYWVGEPHAPTYYFLLWAWRKLVTPLPALFAMRLFSFAAALVLAVGAVYVYGRLVRSRFSVFTLFLLSSPALLFYAEEARSYFFSLFGGVYLGIMFLASLSMERKETSRFVGVALTGAIGCLLCSVHIFSVFTAAYILFGLALIAARVRLWQISVLAGVLIVFAVLQGASLTLLLTSGVQKDIQSFWITRHDVLEALVSLPVLVGLPSFILIATVLGSRALRSTLYGNSHLRAAFYALALATVFVCIVGGFSLLKPVLTLRYLTAWAGFIIPAMAVIAEATIEQMSLRSKKLAIPIVLICVAVDTAAALASPYHPGEWRAAGTFVQSIPECRNSIIPVALLTFVPQDAEEMSKWSDMFAFYAGEPDRFVPANAANLDRAVSQPCPIRLWAAHLRPQYLSNEVLSAFAKTCQREDVDVLKFDRGYLFVAASNHAASVRWTGSRTTCPNLMNELRAIRPGGSTANSR
jgi:hypothetical protein